MLARGASAHYLATYGVGIETWRVLVMLAIEGRVTAQRVVHADRQGQSQRQPLLQKHARARPDPV